MKQLYFFFVNKRQGSSPRWLAWPNKLDRYGSSSFTSFTPSTMDLQLSTSAPAPLGPLKGKSALGGTFRHRTPDFPTSDIGLSTSAPAPLGPLKGKSALGGTFRHRTPDFPTFDIGLSTSAPAPLSPLKGRSALGGTFRHRTPDFPTSDIGLSTSAPAPLGPLKGRSARGGTFRLPTFDFQLSLFRLLTAFLLAFPLLTHAQGPCRDYPCVIEKAKRAIDAKNYTAAFENLESAAAYPGSKPAEISSLREKLFQGINAEKERADQKATEAADSAREALKEQKRANQKTKEANTAAEKALAATQQAERISRSNINALRALQLAKENPTQALRLAEMNYHLYPQSETAVGIFRELLDTWGGGQKE